MATGSALWRATFITSSLDDGVSMVTSACPLSSPSSRSWWRHFSIHKDRFWWSQVWDVQNCTGSIVHDTLQMMSPSPSLWLLWVQQNNCVQALAHAMLWSRIGRVRSTLDLFLTVCQLSARALKITPLFALKTTEHFPRFPMAQVVLGSYIIPRSVVGLKNNQAGTARSLRYEM